MRFGDPNPMLRDENQNLCQTRLKELQNKGFDLNAFDTYGNTLLTLAVQRNLKKPSHDAIDALINLGVDINKPNKNGETPLVIAIKNGDENTVKKLLGNKKIDLWREDPQGKLALDVAMTFGNEQIKKLIKEDTYFAAALKIGHDFNSGKVDVARHVAKKIFSSLDISEEELGDLPLNEGARKIIRETISEMQLQEQKTFAEYMAILSGKIMTFSNEAVRGHTYSSVADETEANNIIQKIVQDEALSIWFDEYLKKNNQKDLALAFRNRKMIIILDKFFKLYNSEK